MKQLERIGVSLEKQLLASFDQLVRKRGYSSRSEAIRDLIREHLTAEQLTDPKTKAVAAVSLVYDHHATRLMEKLTTIQHSRLLQTICSMHIHLDEHDCMEVIVLRGSVGEIKKTAENIVSRKGVKLSRICFVTTPPA